MAVANSEQSPASKPDQLPTDGPPPISATGKFLVLLAALLGWMFDGFEMGMFPLVAHPAMKELLNLPEEEFRRQFGQWNGLVTAGFLVGAAAGGILFGWLGDRIGRVRAMTLSVLVYSLFSGVAAFATAPWHIAATRMVAALGMGGEWALGVALVMEVWPGASRPLMAGLIGAASNVGFLLIGLIGLGVGTFVGEIGAGLAAVMPQHWVDRLVGNGGWRLLALIGAAPAVLTLLVRLFVPESERWKHAAATGPRNRVADIFAPKVRWHTTIGTTLAAIALLGTWASTQNLPNLAASITKVPDARPWTQIWSAAGAIVGTIVAALLAQVFNRRVVYFGLALASLAFTAWFFRAKLPYGDAFLASVFCTGALTASFYGWLPLYLPELFPTRIRATAQGFAFNAGRIFAAVGSLVTGIMLGRLFDGDWAVMCQWISLIYIVGLVAIWFAPETKGKPLPE